MLGVVVDCSELASGVITVDNKPERIHDISQEILNILETGRCLRPQAASLRGRLQYASNQIFGRVAVSCMTSLAEHQFRSKTAFISESLGEEGLAKSVVVAAPANVSPVLRLKATHMAHVIAEYFRDQGQNVLLLCDSLTRVAHAQREIGLAIGEPPTAKGYPPSVFALLPNLIERGGVGRNGFGSITAIYTVLAEGDDASDPIVDIARASLDGQVMLSRKLADSAHYPAIDLNGSISRLMQSLLEPEDLKQANKLRRLWSLYQQNVDLIQVGAYQTGSNLELDEAIRLREKIVNFLRQDMNIGQDYEKTRDELRQLMTQ
jgi:flagellum-specific ATP synthase